MERYISITIFLLCIASGSAQGNDYENTLIAASYGFSHIKNAHSANNRAHTQEYAYRAMIAYNKVEKLTQKCGCPQLNEMAYQAKSNASKALQQDTYERSRFYAKRVKEIGSQLLVQITECYSGRL